MSPITFCLEVDDHKPNDFYREMIGFTCKRIKTELQKNLDNIRLKI